MNSCWNLLDRGARVCTYSLLIFAFLVNGTFAASNGDADGGLEDLNFRDSLIGNGFLDVSQAPYNADPEGKRDATEAIQRAVNDARDKSLICFFPTGTYLISDTISCEQPVKKLDAPRFNDRKEQHYWDIPLRIVLIGSTKGERPVLKLAPDAKGFDNPEKPKKLVWIWTQTRNSPPGKKEPIWGKEQPNISFNHYFIGIDIDIRGHAGAIGIRHSGSQGSTLQDCKILAENAYTGLSNCPGQAAGTYNVEVIGGDYAFVAEPSCRFPILVGCKFRGQKNAAIRYARGGCQTPTLLVGCVITNSSGRVFDLTTERSYAGISLVDCVIEMEGGVFAETKRKENIYLEDSFIRGAEYMVTEGTKLSKPDEWTLLERYSTHKSKGVNLVDGKQSEGEIFEWKTVTKPDVDAVVRKHWTRRVSFEDEDVVNVRAFGAKGDGKTDDFKAFATAIEKHDNVFVPPGDYRLTGDLKFRKNTRLFSVSRAFTSIGSGNRGARGNGSFSITTVDAPDASPELAFLSVRGRINWRSGKGVLMHVAGNLNLSGNAGGQIHAHMVMRQQFVLENIKNPLAFYTLNVERVRQNPQAVIQNSRNVRLYYYKVEAGTIRDDSTEDANTPLLIRDSSDIRIACMYGNVKSLNQLPMLKVENSKKVVVSQLKTFAPGSFPHLQEVTGESETSIPSTSAVAFFERN